MTSVRSRSLADRVARAASSCKNMQSLADAIFAAVCADVPFAFACLATTDPVSELITAAFKSAPLPIGDEQFAAAEYGRPDINQFAELARRPVPVGVLSIDTSGEPERCHRFREFMAPTFGFTDEVRLACRAGDTTWGLLALYRGAGEPPFTAADAAALAGIHEVVAECVRRTLFASVPASDEAAVGPSVLVVDARDRVTDVTAAAHRQIDELGGWDNGSLPANVLAVAALARASELPATTRVQGRSGRWLALRAMALAGPTTDRSVVVTIDTAPAAAVGEMTLAARGLTAREQDVARLVLQGASTKVIAGSLHLSPHTVQDHLKAIFRKLEVTSRREMVARLVLIDEAGAVG